MTSSNYLNTILRLAVGSVRLRIHWLPAIAHCARKGQEGSVARGRLAGIGAGIPLACRQALSSEGQNRQAIIQARDCRALAAAIVE
jgi:hypothetical protein